jgi:predicted Fe-Mo cluster-binding NifX family protein
VISYGLKRERAIREKHAVIEKTSIVAMTVLAKSNESRLSPFFGLAPWLLLHQTPSDELRLIPNEGRTVENMVALIRDISPNTLICGHIPTEVAADLSSAGIEVRIGPCSVPARDLVPRAASLPQPVLRPVD